jgi:addiction module RelE/StbE family toxin
MAQVAWSERAISDLETIHRFIAQDSPAAADLIVDRLRIATRQLADFPGSGRLVPEASDRGVRELIDSPYRVVYRVREATVEIVTVLHGARQVSPADTQ